MIHECGNGFYLNTIMPIGGIESHFFYMSKKYGPKYDMTIFYKSGDANQLRRIRKNVRCVKFNQGDTIKAKVFFCCFNTDILDSVDADHIYLVLHGDYKDMVERGQLSRSLVPQHPKIEKFLGVSRHVCKTWTELTGIPAEFIGEPVVIEAPKQVPIFLISATRLTAEKGWQRMKKLCDILNEHEVKFFWFVFTNSQKKDVPKNMILQNPRLDISEILPMFDAYVQLSDNEGFCLSVVEALLSGIPVIGTDISVFHEIGLNESNSVLLSLDMDDVPVDKILDICGRYVPNYKEPDDDWDKFMDHTPKSYIYDEYEVIATNEWQKMRLIDTELNHVPKPDETWIVTKERYETIRTFEDDNGIRLVEVV